MGKKGFGVGVALAAARVPNSELCDRRNVEALDSEWTPLGRSAVTSDVA